MSKYFNKNITYEELIEVLTEKTVDYVNDSNMELIKLGLNSFQNIGKKDRAVSYAKKVDDLYDNSSIEKFPAILLGLSVISINEDYAEKLSDDALALFSTSYILMSDSIDDINNMISMVSPEILNTICEKTNNTLDRTVYCDIFEHDNNKLTDIGILQICDKIRNMNNNEFEKLKKENYNNIYKTGFKNII